MDLAVAVVAFAVVLPAELPDKSLFASLVLGTRYPGWLVWSGVSAAFLLHVVLAVAVGGLLSRLPSPAVLSSAAVLFAVGAVLLWRSSDDDVASDDVLRPASSVRVFALSFALVFVGEWGDLTQLVTANLAARYADPVSVGVGAGAALLVAAALAVTLGRRLPGLLPRGVVRRVAAAVLAVMAVLTAMQLLW